MKVRVRGIYATALSKLLLDHGFVLTLPSKTIMKRLNIPRIQDPPEATVKHDENNPTNILVIGFKNAVERIAKVLDRNLEYAGRIDYKLGKDAIIVGKVAEDKGSHYVIDLGKKKGRLYKSSRSRIKIEVGEIRLFRIVTPPTNVNDIIILDPVIAVIGKYARLYDTMGPHSVSSHIKDENKVRRLMELARNVPRGYKVRRRSSAEYAEDRELVKELRELVTRLEEVKFAEYSEEDLGRIVIEGEALKIYVLTPEDRRILDRIRDTVVPTVDGHHARKSAEREVSKELSTAVEVIEKAIDLGVDRNLARRSLIEYALDVEELGIIHMRPNGETLRLKPGKITDRKEDEIILYRTFSGRGKYDGIDVPIEPGDYGITRIKLNERFIVHEYYNDKGELKGIYVNINTPPEIIPGFVRYVDLYVDVIRTPEKGAAIIDREELKARYERGLIPKKAYEKAMDTAQKVLEELKSRTPRCFLPYMPQFPQLSLVFSILP